MKVAFQEQSTSTDNKIACDLDLRKLIKIAPDDHVIMLVGAPDGLERHYQNVIAWGGTTENLTIVDASAKIIKSLEAHHDQVLFRYNRPTFKVSDLNEVLQKWNRSNGIGVIDFDGTAGLSPYHLQTMLHAERLEAKYLIVVASARIQNFDLKNFSEGLGLVNRKVYVPKSKQLETRGKFDTYYAEEKKSCRTTHDIFNQRVEGRGHEIVTSFSYYGVSPMVLSLFKLSQQSVTKYIKQLEREQAAFINQLILQEVENNRLEREQAASIKKCFAEHEPWNIGWDGKVRCLFDDEFKNIGDKLWIAKNSALIENQLEYIKTDEYKKLIECPHDEHMRFYPNRVLS